MIFERPARMNTVMKSQVVLLSAHAARLGLSIAIASLLGRHLAPADFGFVALVSSIFIVAGEFLDMGTTAVATRAMSAQPARERETLASLIALRRLLCIAAVAVVFGLACSDYATRDEHRIVLAVAACALSLLYLNAYQLAFQVRQAYGQAAAWALAAQLGFLVASAVALRLRAGGAVIGLLVVAREIAQVLGNRRVAVRMLGDRIRAPWRHPGMWALLKAGWMIGVAGLAYKLAAYAGGFLLWKMSAPETLASFSAAQQLLAPLAGVAWLFVTPLIAAMSAALARDAAAFRVQLEGYVALLVAASALLAAAGYFTAPFVLRLLYGEVYAAGPWSAVGALRWLALGYLFALVSPVLIVGEMVRGNAFALLAAATACLAINLAGNALAIPVHGAEGAAMALCASEAFLFFVLLARAAARRDASPSVAWLAYLAPAALLAGALWMLSDLPLWQLAVACIWAPASLLMILRLPAQKACRASLAKTAAHGKLQSA